MTTTADDPIPRARAGDRTALNAALDRCRPALVLFVRGRLPRHLGDILAEEIVQDACLLACQRFADFREGTLVAFRAWLRAFAAFRLAEWRKYAGRQKRDYRRDVGQPAGEPTAPWPAPLEGAARHQDTPSRLARRREREALLSAAMAAVLTPWERQALRLHHLEGRPVAEVAVLLGSNPTAVRTACWRARKKLRDALRPSHFLSAS